MPRIKTLREKLGVSQEEFSKRLKALDCNVSQSAVAKWETGETLPRAKKLPVIAKALNCTVDELLDKEAI